MTQTHNTRQEKLEQKRWRRTKPIVFLCGTLAIMLVAAISLTSCVYAPASTSSAYEDITVAEAQQLISENGNLIILDVRAQSEYDSGHIPNAILIPVGELVDRLGELDRTKTILVYCRSGVRSVQASEILMDSAFFQVRNLEDGIIAWQEAGAEINHPPIIETLASDETKAPPWTACHIECIASDPDGDELSYEWSTEGGNISGKDSTVTWTAPEVLGIHAITVVVTDGQGGESRSSLSINVRVNHPPVIEELIITPEREKDFNHNKMRIYKGTSCDIECIVSDPDGDELSYQWSVDLADPDGYWTAVGSISGEGSVVTWTAPERGKIVVSVLVSDGEGGTDTEELVLKVETCRCRL